MYELIEQYKLVSLTLSRKQKKNFTIYRYIARRQEQKCNNPTKHRTLRHKIIC